MLTQNEITSLSLSPTKKDFVQIWNELLDVASKLSERWDPTSTNESDPGIVILKALAGIADKLNYNIDKNTLEAFMPTAAQEDSMRKLCDMLGYSVKYYQSAKTDLTIKYHNTDPSSEESKALNSGLIIPKFTPVTNSDQDVSYFTLNPVPVILTSTTPTIDLECMEGQVVKCESVNDNNVISANQITENRRYYLPETQIAENGIFVYNIFNDEGLTGSNTLEDGERWSQVTNLNVQRPGSRVYKFGYDSYESRPYLEFPDDYAELFGDGLFIYYTRTSGAAGNISARTLTKLEFPSTDGWKDVATDSISVENAFAATTGANIETIKQAYNNFKKTIGTFETLVTCRDYMNKIYTMVSSLNKPLVSNVLVTDIRNDLNRAVTICSCDRAGIFYKETPKVINHGTTEATTTYIASEINKPKISDTPFSVEIPLDLTDDGVDNVTNSIVRETNWYIGDSKNPILLHADKYGTNFLSNATNFLVDTKNKHTINDSEPFVPTKESLGEVSAYNFDNDDRSNYWLIRQNDLVFTTKLPINWIEHTSETTETKPELAMDNFDLILYPFKSYTQIKSNVRDVRSVYDSSFTYSSKTFREVKEELEDSDLKTIAHNIISPKPGDTLSINNYLKLNATIATTSKITVEEGSIIIDKIKIALANAFNMRELDFGEEIPFDSIVEVIENADSRIRLVSLNEPALYTTFSVYEDDDISGNPIIKEYAVASDWLDTKQAYEADRFNMDKFRTAIGENKEETKVSLSTFNTKEARELYNNLAVRNVLAGRIPLFDYNETFKTSFSESAYQETKVLDALPANVSLAEPTETEPFTIKVVGDKIYTGRLDAGEIIYSETVVPDAFKNNIITEVASSNITDITTECKIIADAGKISEVKLESGEFVKFRAPNFITLKTYPAYVNYHLALNKETVANAVNAEAYSLFSLLDKNTDNWTLDNKKNNWQAALDYFKSKETDLTKPRYLNYVTRKQTISAFNNAGETEDAVCKNSPTTGGTHVDDGNGVCKNCNAKLLSHIQKSDIIIEVNDKALSEEQQDIALVLNNSGCLKLSEDAHEITYDKEDNKYIVKPVLEWVRDPVTDAVPSEPVNIDIAIKISSLFITSTDVISAIDDAVQTRLNELVGMTNANGGPVLPTAGAWTLSFKYESVPFEPASLTEWKNFVLTNKEVVGFTPFRENDVVLWRVYGEGYDTGKYVLQNSEKLLEFNSNYFGLLPESRLRGVYVIKNAGSDAQANIIANNSEYKLRANEYLYIEYTPSTTNEDGSTQDGDPVTEILGEGTIIRPSGFETGLMDSSEYVKTHSYYKTVSFETDDNTSKQVSLHRFGANEQVEIRDFARVVLDKSTFKATNGSNSIFYYKNFNGIDALEDPEFTGTRSYTLKEGEYFFYTDQNKTELAYFSAGTEIKLTGSLVLGQFESIELSTIFDTGLTEIPWGRLRFTSKDDAVILQEYQYITLGPEDTITNMTLMGGKGISTAYLDSVWQYCDDVEYTLAGSTESQKLPAVNTYEDTIDLSKGSGWEVSSTLELDVAYNAEQILRTTDKVQTSLTLSNNSLIGGGENKPIVITPSKDKPLAFKTNLNCQTSSNHLNIKDVYSNPKKLPGFELKFFAKETPAIVETVPGKVIPYDRTITDISNWEGTEVTISSVNALWREIDLKTIKVQDLTATKPKAYDEALRLPINIIPKTYGIFSIYLEYTTDAADAETWIEVLPGVAHEDVTIFNLQEGESSQSLWKAPLAGVTNGSERLVLKPGINCIRVNKTGRIFIKSSKNAQGSLFFDDLKLVNCTPITYKISVPTGNGENMIEQEIPASTLGLNVKQLGYLNPADTNSLEDTLAVDDDIRKSLISGCIEDAMEKLTVLSSEQTKLASKDFEALIEYQPLLGKILSIMKEINTELANHAANVSNTAYASKLVSLINNYKTVHEELEAEQALYDALVDNKNVELVSGELADLLNSFTDYTDTVTDLLGELEQLKAESLAEVSTISRDRYLESFDKNIKNDFDELLSTDGTEATDFIIELENASRSEIEQNYDAKLIPLISKINNIVNSEERINLLTILSSAKANAEIEKRATLIAQIKQLIATADNTELEGLVDSMMTAAVDADYRTLDALAVRLKTFLGGKEFADLLVELELAAEACEDTQVTSLITTLITLFGTDNSTDESVLSSTATDATIKAASANKLVNTIIKECQSESLRVNDAAESTFVTKLVRALHTNAIKEYNAKIKKALEEIQTANNAITGIGTTYSNALNQIQNSSDSQVAEILAELRKVGEERSNYLEKLETRQEDKDGKISYEYPLRVALAKCSADTFKYDDLKDYLPFHENAVYTTWRAEKSKNMIEGIHSTARSIIARLDNLSSSGTACSAASIDLLLIESRSKFIELVNRVETLVKHKEQQQAFAALLTSLPNLESKALVDARGNISENNFNQVVRTKITEYTKVLNAENSTSKEKQLAANDLKNAVKDNLNLLNKIDGALAELLWPTLIALETKLPEAFDEEVAKNLKVEKDFYKNWAVYLVTARSGLFSISNEAGASSICSSVSAAVKAAYDQLDSFNEAIIKDHLNIWFTENPDHTVAYLPASCKKLVDRLFAMYELQNLIEDARLVDFASLTPREVGAWPATKGFKYSSLITTDESFATIFNNLEKHLEQISGLTEVAEGSKEAHNYLVIEKQLLADINRLDPNRLFYYTAPCDMSRAIEFNESDDKLNTLMNPATNYDINNVNNCFVISKLDIDYLDRGLQIARSSRLN